MIFIQSFSSRSAASTDWHCQPVEMFQPNHTCLGPEKTHLSEIVLNILTALVWRLKYRIARCTSEEHLGGLWHLRLSSLEKNQQLFLTGDKTQRWQNHQTYKTHLFFVFRSKSSEVDYSMGFGLFSGQMVESCSLYLIQEPDFPVMISGCMTRSALQLFCITWFQQPRFDVGRSCV